ncbi:MAG: TIGR00296 family protein [Nanoarchaeota archaeon]|nr:TIGR00296 family protein [Nanoarchaeota archaeon]MBU4352509.1 TIGR00296 family protein [Nanoarchaeota archaeon]MBU4456147.1 TIGR00296 family protein [Nanoarchaeota archaeon]MCG2719622.1 TIGR00296 family protein [Nanoarchaeota archaeon]
MFYSLDDGKKLIQLARASIKNKDFSVKGFEEKRGVFVTLYSYPEKELRGCIGFPEPVEKLKEAVKDAAKSAAFRDSRFKSISENEEFVIEISILTEPKLAEDLEKIKIGKDGLIVDFRGQRGLLLPQVFVEWKADIKQALEMTCEKAGLKKDCYKEKNCKFYKFQAQIFAEKTPNGKVIEKKDKYI